MRRTSNARAAGVAFLDSRAAAQPALGAAEARRVVEGVAAGRLSAEHCWLGFVELAVRFGWRSAAARAYLIAIAKASAR